MSALKTRQLMAAALLGAAASLSACNPANGTDDAGMDGLKQAEQVSVPDRTSMLAMSCSGCHSEAGQAIVSLEGYSREELMTALMRYHDEADGTTVMHRLMRGYSEADMASISVYLAGDKPL
ncbi:hypothetical protein [Henriciella sp.]|uniref:c-type cytochrome n=1 Tax=Henriciella sp. TaxID=1968823 RepID=UPI00261CF37E|nr:hypothetical protein [Henriciella sp.]